jgi:hypothetical protein
VGRFGNEPRTCYRRCLRVRSWLTGTGDVLAVVLGLSFPLLLRPTEDGRFKVVGDCCVPALTDVIALLGPLPPGWACKLVLREDIQWEVPIFVNEKTGEQTAGDPRLPPLEGWEIVKDTSNLALWTTGGYAFRNMESGEKIFHDPRMTSENLRKLGCSIREFELV